MLPADRITSAAIIGNGLMGQGISQVFARAGKRVVLIGRSTASLERAMAAIRSNLEAFVTRGLSSRDEADATLNRIAPHSPLARALLGAAPGDEVAWRRPAGTIHLEIVKIAHVADADPPA